ncbi:MAG: hypothetical protein EOP67_00235 [Sphingomonas sp.]|nr:MAG: hypothetical protein EOP67_00235 [Sphingomonas sp.]
MTDGRNAGSGGGDDAETNVDAAYYLQRAEWHEHRATIAADNSTRSLHRKFAGLYHARSRA